MALKPEFLGLLRDIRDRIFPSINTSEQNVTIMHSEVVALRETFDILSVKDPVNSIPNQPSGEPGIPTVTYNNLLAQFEFGIPQGKHGKDFELNHVVENIVDLYTLIPESGDVAYVNENSKIYVKRYTDVNLNGLDWTDGVYLTPSGQFIELLDTPLEYTSSGGYIVTVNVTEDGLVFNTVESVVGSLIDSKIATESIVVNNKIDTRVPAPTFPQDEGLPLVAKATGAVYEEILGLPDETNNTGKSITNLGTKKTSFWSFVNCNPNVMDTNQTIPDGVSASVVDGFTIEDGITLTIPDGSTLSIV